MRSMEMKNKGKKQRPNNKLVFYVPMYGQLSQI